MDNRKISADYTTIAQNLIAEDNRLEDIKHSDVTIIYLESEEEKTNNGRKVLGQCEKISDKYKWGIPCEFTITVFKPNVEDLEPGQLRLVILHELMHVGIEQGRYGERYFIKPHDLEDFRELVNEYGADWSKPGQPEAERK